MSAALVIAGKDLRQRLRDRSLFVLGILAPLGLTVILSGVLGGSDEPAFTPEFAVADEDQSAISRALVENVLGGLVTEGVVHLTAAPSAAEAERMAEEGKIAAAVIVPAGFGTAVAAGQPAELRVTGNPDAPIGREIARAIVEGFASDLNSIRLSVALVSMTGDGITDLAGLARRAAEMPTPVVIAPDEAGTRQLDARTYIAAGMAVFFLFFTVQAGVLSLLVERRMGTLARLLVAPIRPAAILVGKSLASFVAGLLSMAVLVVASTALLGANWGSPVGVAALSAAGVIAAMGITALVASLARTVEQAAGLSSIIAVVLGALGGSFFPVSQGPAFLATISLISPHAWLLRGFGDLAGGAGAGEVMRSAAVVTAFGVVTGGFALVLLRQRGLAR